MILRVKMVRSLFMIIFVLMQGCGAQPGEVVREENQRVPNLNPPQYPSLLKCDGPYVESWEHFGQGFILNYCIGCHSVNYEENDRFGAPLNIDFNTHRQVLLYRTRILSQLQREPPTMPPDKVVEKEDLKRMIQWLRCGAP